MTSINSMIKLVAGLADTRDVSDWENDFITSIVEQTQGGKNVGALSEKQVTALERIYKKHFA